MDNEEIQGVKFSEFPSATPGNSDEVVGLHSGDNARFSVANFILAIRQGLANIFVPLTRTINGKANQTQIAKVIGSPAGVTVLTDDYVIYEGQLYKSRNSFSEGVYPATYLSWLDPITIGGLNDVNKILSETIELPLSTVGSSITQTARLVGQCTTLFRIPASKILSLSAADAALSPASVMIFGVYADGLYVAATQSCTLSSSVKVRVIYTK